jgi:hypothetical protein
MIPSHLQSGMATAICSCHSAANAKEYRYCEATIPSEGLAIEDKKTIK